MSHYSISIQTQRISKKRFFFRGVPTTEIITISIEGISRGARFYAISNEFDLAAAWKNENTRENILRPLFFHLRAMENPDVVLYPHLAGKFSKSAVKRDIWNHGLTLETIFSDMNKLKVVDDNAVFYGYGWGDVIPKFKSLMQNAFNKNVVCEELKDKLRLNSPEVIDTLNGSVYRKVKLVGDNMFYPTAPPDDNPFNPFARAKWMAGLAAFLISYENTLIEQ